MTEFDEELAENIAAIARARTALRDRVCQLSDGDLDRARRGGWTVRDVLRHVLTSEVAYARVVAHLRSLSLQLADVTADDLHSVTPAENALTRTRAALLDAVGGVDEAAFYDLRSLGHEQYSVLSVLENVANHDHEHLEQLEKILAS